MVQFIQDIQFLFFVYIEHIKKFVFGNEFKTI